MLQVVQKVGLVLVQHDVGREARRLARRGPDERSEATTKKPPAHTTAAKQPNIGMMVALISILQANNKQRGRGARAHRGALGPE